MKACLLIFFILVLHPYGLLNAQTYHRLVSDRSVAYVPINQTDANLRIMGSDKVKPDKTDPFSGPFYSAPTDKWAGPAQGTVAAEQGSNTSSLTVGTIEKGLEIFKTTFAHITPPPIAIRKAISRVGNVLDNSGFEQDYLSWNNINSSGNTTFSIDRVNPAVQNKSARAIVTAAGPHSWSSQINRTIYDLADNNTYILTFMARADVNGRKIGANIVNPKDYSIYETKTYILSNQWQTYSLPVSLAAGVNTVLLTLDMGYEVGTFWFDEVTFGNTGITSTPIKPSEKLMPAFTIAPNPVADQFVLQHQPLPGDNQTYKVTITDMLMRTHWASVLISPTANHPIDVKTLPAGLYILTVTDGVQQKTLKLLKQ